MWHRPAGGEPPVVQTVAAIRLTGVASTVVALLAFAVVVILSKDRLGVITASVIEAVLWAGGSIFLFSRTTSAPPPITVTLDGLPAIVGPWNRAASTVAALVAFYAAAGAWALALHNGICFGVALGLPVAIWSNFCRAKRTQRDLQGVLWNEVGFIGAHQNRIRYLSVQS
jgi:hypothetical protein